MPCCQASSSSFSQKKRRADPALLTRTSVGPKSFSVCFTAVSASFIRAKSARTVITSNPSFARFCRACSRFASLRDAIDTRAPSPANARAHAKPIPLLPPVMTTTLPSNPSFIALPFSGERFLDFSKLLFHGIRVFRVRTVLQINLKTFRGALVIVLVRQNRSQKVIDARNPVLRDRKSTRLNSSHLVISYAVFCLKKKKKTPV